MATWLVPSGQKECCYISELFLVQPVLQDAHVLVVSKSLYTIILLNYPTVCP